MSQNGRNGRTLRILESFWLQDFLPDEVARQFAKKGWLNVADILSAQIADMEIDSKPTTDLNLPTYIERRLIGRGYTTIGSLDTLTVRQVLVFFSGLGKGAVTKINTARGNYGKPPLPRH